MVNLRHSAEARAIVVRPSRLPERRDAGRQAGRLHHKLGGDRNLLLDAIRVPRPKGWRLCSNPADINLFKSSRYDWQDGFSPQTIVEDGDSKSAVILIRSGDFDDSRRSSAGEVAIWRVDGGSGSRPKSPRVRRGPG